VNITNNLTIHAAISLFKRIMFKQSFDSNRANTKSINDWCFVWLSVTSSDGLPDSAYPGREHQLPNGLLKQDSLRVVNLLSKINMR